ncbi:hypothetical protein [Fuerstiella marisgermanici]|uniref:Uncharacterized protein n=1 Tax=Fuerstiella marisgermanici TaxID=1891926 RepID=A0A1P8WP99_9PLAN|nr:hypothetical protein [Fuerstiella marisgermanici]APZ95865.1 hypothetical protein Fuma_05528 [Fuerstiella marisgermanici]
MSQQNNQPVHRIRFGLVSAAIFRNTSSEGQDFFNTTFERAYRDGDDWKHTKSFRRDDLLVLAKLSDLAHTWICGQIQDDADSDQS